MKGELEFAGFLQNDAIVEMKQILEQISIDWLKKKRKIIQIEIEKAEKENNPERLKVLFEEFKKLVS
jgi:uncharacterized protein YuzE